MPIPLYTIWIRKAEQDLAAAKLLCQGEEQYWDVAIYHCQQAAEKALKGCLIYLGQDAPRTHDLRFLLQLTTAIIPDLESLADAADELNPYATAFRYPGEVFEPTQWEMQEALDLAGLVLEKVKERMT